MIAIRDLEMTKERLLSFAEYAKDAQPEVLVTLIQTIVERIYIVDKDDERYCHIFIKGMDYSDETVALVALMHDICKVNFYAVDYRNAKNEQGVWEKVPYYTIRDEMPYGHGEKSVYMLSGFLRLSREEAFAIRYHMGFSGPEDRNQIGRALEMFPLALALNVADMEASYFLEGTPDKSGGRL